eukprot:ANDGO_01276.mRNA.1 hypothetical protein
MADEEGNDRDSIIAMKRSMQERASAKIVQRRAKRRKTSHADPTSFAAAIQKVIGGKHVQPLSSESESSDNDGDTEDEEQSASSSSSESEQPAKSILRKKASDEVATKKIVQIPKAEVGKKKAASAPVPESKSESESEDVAENDGRTKESKKPATGLLSNLELKVKEKERKAAAAEKERARLKAIKVASIEKYHIIPRDQPSYGDEKALRKIGSAAVVKLFNAVRKAQEAVRDRDLATLSFTQQQKTEKDAQKVFQDNVNSAGSSSQKREWDVLRDDFVHARSKQHQLQQQHQHQEGGKGSAKDNRKRGLAGNVDIEGRSTRSARHHDDDDSDEEEDEE